MGEDPAVRKPETGGPIGRMEAWLGALVRSRRWVRNTLRYGAGAFSVTIAATAFIPLGPGWTLVFNVMKFASAALVLIGIGAASDTARELKSREEYEQDGYLKGLRKWREQTNLRAGAMGKLFRQMAYLLVKSGVSRPLKIEAPPHETSGDEVARTFLGAIANAAVIHFGIEAHELKVNLMVPIKSKKGGVKLELVAFAVEDSNRAVGRKPLPTTKGPRPGAVAAYLDNSSQYIPDTHEVEGMDHTRPYRSIISWPIQRNGEEHPLGIVNIDSVKPLAFGPLGAEGDEDREAARLLCSDILIGIGIALLDGKCFHCSGARV